MKTCALEQDKEPSVEYQFTFPRLPAELQKKILYNLDADARKHYAAHQSTCSTRYMAKPGMLEHASRYQYAYDTEKKSPRDGLESPMEDPIWWSFDECIGWTRTAIASISTCSSKGYVSSPKTVNQGPSRTTFPNQMQASGMLSTRSLD